MTRAPANSTRRDKLSTRSRRADSDSRSQFTACSLILSPCFEPAASWPARPSAACHREPGPWTPARHTIHNIQPDLDVLKGGRPNYATTPDSLIDAAYVVAVEFQTIAAANNYWRT
ncbi:hexameric tyrosine-coordinated heme protein [Streptomyces sp. FXJ1.4098]|uniref:hexameric tyrosine-coordinated heme protein n=1 Tax=Streptomyces sp. NPDC020845 TaxID=3365096 RepID=UPI0029939B49|nr:hexameric tyrosine-coordinated heme protein [Streptomyces sp. FXJ1.4098]